MRKVWRSMVLAIIIMLPLCPLLYNMAHKCKEKNTMYTHAVHIQDNAHAFKQLIQQRYTGDIFIGGVYKALQPVSMAGLPGEYLYIRCERYDRVSKKERSHTGSTVHTTSTLKLNDGWEYIKTNEAHSNKIIFSGKKFYYDEFPTVCDYEITTIYDTSHLHEIKYVYYTLPVRGTGTLYSHMYKGQLSRQDRFYLNHTVDAVVAMLQADNDVWFKIIWGIGLFTLIFIWGFMILTT